MVLLIFEPNDIVPSASLGRKYRYLRRCQSPDGAVSSTTHWVAPGDGSPSLNNSMVAVAALSAAGAPVTLMFNCFTRPGA
jgi:hypothetical protein